MKKYNTYFNGGEKAIFDAIWQYVLDHAEVSNDGVLFVKFHTTGKEQFRKRISYRMKGYQRDYINENTASDKRKIAIQKTQLGHEEMNRKIKEVAEMNRKRNL